MPVEAKLTLPMMATYDIFSSDLDYCGIVDILLRPPDVIQSFLHLDSGAPWFGRRGDRGRQFRVSFHFVLRVYSMVYSTKRSLFTS